METAGVFTRELAEVFAEDSENDRTFHGFSDGELSGQDEVRVLEFGSTDWEDEDGAQSKFSPEQQKATFKPSAGFRSFRLRVALRSTRASYTDDDEEEGDAEEERTQKSGLKNAGKARRAKKERHVKFEEEEEEEEEAAAVARPSPAEERRTDSAEDASDSFLARREQNIKANKAMLAQLMADLQKMPGGGGFLRKHAGKQPKDRSARPPRSGVPGESRRNPERASRRQTRSMGGGAEHPSAPQEAELELSLEEELLEVRRAPRRCAPPRLHQSKPHVVRSVEDITEDELQLVAENMTDKVYNRVTGSTCHQCRQKTVDTKTCCRSEDCRGIQGQFCGPCLRNRYGEDVKKALLDPGWQCPPCRGICNCSFCRQREGRCPTGILFPLAQYHGFSDVHSYLQSLRNKLKSENDVEM